MEHVVIIGNGISGVTAARHIRKLSNKRITIISAETDYFFSRTALMYVYMGHMKFEHTQPYENWFWERNNIELKKAFVKSINFKAKTLFFDSGESMQYDQLILGVGSKPNKFGWPGQDLEGVQGLYSYQDLELMEKNTTEYTVKRAVIVGGGLIGVEMAEMLHSRNIPVTFLVRDDRFWGGVLPKEEGKLVEKELKSNHVDLRFNTELKEIKSNGNGRVTSVITSTGEEIECEFVGLTAGVSPNIDFLKDSELELGRGILVDQYLKTNQPDVYAIGDCVQHRNPAEGRKTLEQVWYTGRIMGETVARTICDTPMKYHPGHWFNSAKFFDLEYQTYGWVSAELKDGEQDFYWEDTSQTKCLHFVFDAKTRKFKGVNTFGIRLRHEFFDRYLNEGVTIEHVIQHLRDANFDPEFYAAVEQEVIDKFNAEYGTQLKLKNKSWKRILGSE